jgi:hypothetical protein
LPIRSSACRARHDGGGIVTQDVAGVGWDRPPASKGHGKTRRRKQQATPPRSLSLFFTRHSIPALRGAVHRRRTAGDDGGGGGSSRPLGARSHRALALPIGQEQTPPRGRVGRHMVEEMMMMVVVRIGHKSLVTTSHLTTNFPARHSQTHMGLFSRLLLAKPSPLLRPSKKIRYGFVITCVPPTRVIGSSKVNTVGIAELVCGWARH